MTPISTRLVRLLNMVPYFQANPRITLAEAAADLGLSVKQLEADLKQLWMCGLPGYSPGDLIDFEFSGDTVEVTFSAGIDRPLKLTSPEATGLLVALRALADIPGVVDPQAARSAIAKLAAAAGAVGHDTTVHAVMEQAPAESRAAATVRAAVQDMRALSIDYYAASRDTLTTRVVDPIRVLLIGGHSYLEAWSREAEGVRLFRFDRIVDAAERAEPSAPPEPVLQGPPDTSLFDGDPALPSATLRVAPSAGWMFEYYPMRDVRELPDGSCEAVMTYASDDWMTRLVVGFGSAVQVLAPESLARRVRNAAVTALECYQAAEQASEKASEQA
jgi:proteasome accessory factor C